MNEILTQEKSIYIQIREMIENDILRDILLEEERVPSTNELAKLYAINPATAAKGVNLLVDEGILYKKRGIGMFVATGAKRQITEKRKKNFYEDYVKSLPAEVQFFLYLGVALNVFCVSFMSLLVFLPETAKFLITKGFALLKKLHLMKEKNNRAERLENSMEVYKAASVFLKGHKLVIFNTTVISFIQRFFLFFITYVVYRSFGLHELDAWTITILQSIISISVDMLPLPGGMGISERLYLLIFTPVFGGLTAATASMMVSRGFSYYILILVSGIISFITHLTVKSVKKETKEMRG